MHTLYLLVLVFTTARTGYVTPMQGVSQLEETRLVAVGSGAPALSPHLHSPLSALGTHLWACKTHEMREVEYGLE